MKRLFKYLGCTLLVVPALAWADNKAAVDWTPFFKSWEQGCNFGKDEAALKMNLFKGNTFNRLVLPVKYATAVGKPTVSRKQDKDGTNKVNIAYIPIKNGSYYDLPISAIEYTVGADNGINYRIMTFEAPHAAVRTKLKSVKYKAEVSEEMGTSYQASLDKQKTKAVLLCDASA